MDVEGIIILDSVSGLPLFSRLSNGIDETMFSAFLTAIQQFASQLSLGGLSSFTTEEKGIYLVGRSRVVTALIAPVSADFKRIYSIGLRIGTLFESQYEIKNVNDISQFEGFDQEVQAIFEQEKVPFLVQVAEFAKKEFRGDVAVQPTIPTRDGGRTTIDVVVDGGKKRDMGLRSRMLMRMEAAFAEDVTFVKAIDGTAGRGEVLEYLESLRLFGDDGDDNTEEYSYFPHRAVVVARDYSPTVMEELEKLERRNGKFFVKGTHISKRMKAKWAPDASRCYIELWKWGEPYPERVFN